VISNADKSASNLEADQESSKSYLKFRLNKVTPFCVPLNNIFSKTGKIFAGFAKSKRFIKVGGEEGKISALPKR
jgi:hypothetical protein